MIITKFPHVVNENHDADCRRVLSICNVKNSIRESIGSASIAYSAAAEQKKQCANSHTQNTWALHPFSHLSHLTIVQVLVYVGNDLAHGRFHQVPKFGLP